VQPTTNIAQAVSGAVAVFVAIPSTAFRDVVRDNAAVFENDQAVISLTKGIEKSGFKLMSEVLMEELPRCRIGVLSGPNLAAEIVNRDLTATVIAATDPKLRHSVQKLLGCEYFRVYANIDVYGAELAGALKNIYAIVAGMASALELGENAKSMLITRSLAEMSRFAVSMGANPMTFLGLAGVGDLIVTCTSSKSRNFRIGQAVGQGRSLEDAASEVGQVAEGVHTLRLVKDKAAEIGIYMPLVKGLYDILYGGASIRAVINGLMMAVQNSDVEFILPRK
jgi:glycerol-3-phosphate dehydrogenase (NAD(P)+)